MEGYTCTKFNQYVWIFACFNWHTEHYAYFFHQRQFWFCSIHDGSGIFSAKRSTITLCQPHSYQLSYHEIAVLEENWVLVYVVFYMWTSWAERRQEKIIDVVISLLAVLLGSPQSMNIVFLMVSRWIFSGSEAKKPFSFLSSDILEWPPVASANAILSFIIIWGALCFYSLLRLCLACRHQGLRFRPSYQISSWNVIMLDIKRRASCPLSPFLIISFKCAQARHLELVVLVQYSGVRILQHADDQAKHPLANFY